MEQFGIHGVTEELDDRSAVTTSLTNLKIVDWTVRRTNRPIDLLTGAVTK